MIPRGAHDCTTKVGLEASTAAGNLQALESLPRQMEAMLENVERNVAHFRQQLVELRALSQTRFDHQEELDRLLMRQRELDVLLGEQPCERSADITGLDVAEADPDEAEVPVTS